MFHFRTWLLALLLHSATSCVTDLAFPFRGLPNCSAHTIESWYVPICQLALNNVYVWRSVVNLQRKDNRQILFNLWSVFGQLTLQLFPSSMKWHSLPLAYSVILGRPLLVSCERKTNNITNDQRLSKMAPVAMLRTCILEVPVSNLG
jgi:hypothetical protein